MSDLDNDRANMRRYVLFAVAFAAVVLGFAAVSISVVLLASP